MRWTGSSASRALALVAGLAAGELSLAATKKPARLLYEEARAAEEKLTRSKKLRSDPRSWWSVARRYRKVRLSYPASGYTDDALYYEAEAYRQIDRRFSDRSAVQKALATYLLLASDYPLSKWCQEARFARADLFLNRLADDRAARQELRIILETWPKSEKAAEARKILADLDRPREANLVRVRNIRHWTGKEYTRVVIDLDEEVRFTQARLWQPDRIYFDLFGTSLSRNLATRSFPVQDGFLQRIRVAQNQSDVVRVVLDFESISRYNVFSLHDPYRLVVDILGLKPEPEKGDSPERTSIGKEPSSAPGLETTPPPTTAVPDLSSVSPPDGPSTPSPVAAAGAEGPPPPLPPEPTSDGRFPLSRQLGLAARRVVIDPGHGGHDPGALSEPDLQEKELVLDISRRLSRLLEAEGGYEVILTREDDTYIPLEERTAIANSREADLFISIHANSSRNPRTRGIETYYLNLATTPEAEQTAARENAVSTRRMSELRDLVRQIMNNSRIAESRDFALRIQEAMLSGLGGKASRGDLDLGVKTAPFYVLLGANMPSVLVEVSFISNRQDARLLAGADFRQKIAEAVLKGIRGYTSSLKKVARGTVRLEAKPEVAEKP